jgi:adenylylsulfate kinase
MAGLYEKALLRKRTGEQFAGLGQVIGVDIEFEEDPDAECIIENERGTLDNAIQQTLDFYRSWTQ